MKNIFLAFGFLLSISAFAIEVPSEIQFAGMELKLTEDMRKALKEDIELITKSQKGFQIKVDRANLYFPIIERIFKEEGFPDDFKYLALQESSLVSDAVSSSNAVGFWQFKKESAQEVGLRVDHEVDERMNLISSSRGAVKYLRKNNAVLNNWVYALLAYNTGLGGVKSQVDDKYIGANKMKIDKDIHWYVKRFLSHKLAFENAVGRNTNPSLLLISYSDCSNKSFREISKETEVDVANVEMYNKWALKGHVPSDKNYSVLLPVTPEHLSKLTAKDKVETAVLNDKDNRKSENKERARIERKQIAKREEKNNVNNNEVETSDIVLITKVNNIKAIKAKEGDSPAKLSIKGGINLSDFLRYNDMKSFETIVPGKTYFLQPKRKKAIVLFHTTEDGETIKEISQKYGISISAIRNKNRMQRNESLESGRVLWLRKKRPENVEVEIVDLTSKGKVQEEIKQEVKGESEKQLVVFQNETPVNPNNNSIELAVSDNVLHEVKPGETLYGISKTYTISVDSIRSWNSLSSNDIKPGVKLIVNKVKVGNKERVIEHIVQAGETLFQISRKYEVTVQDIQLWNNKIGTSVSIGEKIFIKKP